MKRRLTIALIVVASAAAVVWFFLNFERQTVVHDPQWTSEARRNNFLAAEIFLGTFGIEAESQRYLSPGEWLPPKSDTIIATLSPQIATPLARELLLDWVRSGGRLVLLPQDDFMWLGAETLTPITVAFLEELGLRLVDIEVFEEEEPGDLPAEEETDNSEPESDFDYMLDLSGLYARIEVAAYSDNVGTLSDRLGVVAAVTPVGEGFVTLYASGGFLPNSALADLDHARLLMNTIAGFTTPGKVWFVYGDDFMSLWQIIWNNAPQMVVASLLALALWLWARAPAIGPRIPPPDDSRRSIVEHVAAAGHFSWRYGAAPSLAEAAVGAIATLAERRHPGFSRESKDSQAKILARITGLDAQHVFSALTNDGDVRHREFAQHMKYLQKIRNRL